jgi:nucleoside-diphosphate-sugar epimerase
MKRVLVTGACGNIGANVVDLLVQRGYSTRAVDLDTPGGRKAWTM